MQKKGSATEETPQQTTFWGGEVRKAKKVPKKQACASTAQERTACAATPVEPPREIPDYASSPIVNYLYVANDLRSVWLTGRARSMPVDPCKGEDLFLPGEPLDGFWHRLTEELRVKIAAQLDEITPRGVGEKTAETILSRWEVIRDFQLE